MAKLAKVSGLAKAFAITSVLANVFCYFIFEYSYPYMRVLLYLPIAVLIYSFLSFATTVKKKRFYRFVGSDNSISINNSEEWWNREDLYSIKKINIRSTKVPDFVNLDSIYFPNAKVVQIHVGFDDRNTFNWEKLVDSNKIERISYIGVEPDSLLKRIRPFENIIALELDMAIIDLHEEIFKDFKKLKYLHYRRNPDFRDEIDFYPLSLGARSLRLFTNYTDYGNAEQAVYRYFNNKINVCWNLDFCGSLKYKRRFIFKNEVEQRQDGYHEIYHKYLPISMYGRDFEYNGTLAARGNIKNGQFDGKWELYDPYMKTNQIRHYKDGVPVGEWEKTYLDKEGNLIKVTKKKYYV